MIEGTVSETARDVGVVRVDVERHPDDDDAVVVGPGQRRRHRREAERGPFNGPDRYIRPTALKGWSPGPASTFVVPIWELAGQLGFACSARPELFAAARIALSGQ